MSAARPKPARLGAPRRHGEALLEEALDLGRHGPPLLEAMLDLLGRRAEVRFHEAIPTAALIPAGDRFIVGIGTPAFDRGKLDARDLLYLIAHELAHLVRDDYRMPRDLRERTICNIAADAVNDAWLTGPAFDGFFCPLTSLPGRRPPTHPVNGLMIPLRAAHAKLGAPDRPRPPASTSRRFYASVIPPPDGAGPVPYRPDDWASAHHTLQVGGEEGALTAALATPLIRPLFDQLPPAPLDDAAGHPFLASAEGQRLAQRLREALGPISALTSRGARPGEGGPTELTQVAAGTPARRLERFLRTLVTEAPVDLCAPSPVGPRPTPTELGPRVGPRAACEWVAGARATPFVHSRPDGGDLPLGLDLYLDASGSMDEDLPALVASLATRCADLVTPPVRVFSIGVHPIGLAELRAGRLPTEGGTSFEALARDLLARRVGRAVVVSDGAAPPLPPGLLAALLRQRARVALVFPGRVGSCPLDPLCPPGWRFSLASQGERS